MASVSLCDPQPIVHEGLRSVLDASSEFDWSGGVETLQNARSELERGADILIIDRSFGLHSLLDWIAQARRQFPRTEIVVWAANVSDVECFKALQAGARAILRKTVPVPVLFDCLRAVMRKELWTENLVDSQESPLGSPRTRPLTPREKEVAALVAKGMKNREIAEALQIATGTVKIHLMHIFEKTGIRDRFELALHGLRLACERSEETPSAGEPVPQAGGEPQTVKRS